jgi:hypothetical protein
MPSSASSGARLAQHLARHPRLELDLGGRGLVHEAEHVVELAAGRLDGEHFDTAPESDVQKQVQHRPVVDVGVQRG